MAITRSKAEVKLFDLLKQKPTTDEKKSLAILKEAKSYIDIIKTINTSNFHDIKNPEGITLLEEAARNGHIKICKLLLEGPSNSSSPHLIKTFCRASYNGQIEIIQLLLEKKMSVNSRNAVGVTPLMVAAEQNQSQTVHFLLEQKANPHLGDKRNGATALTLAAYHGHTNIIKLLLYARADIESLEAGKSALEWAVIVNKPEAVTLLLENRAVIRDLSKFVPFLKNQKDATKEFYLGTLSEQLGQFEKAFSHYQSAVSQNSPAASKRLDQLIEQKKDIPPKVTINEEKVIKTPSFPHVSNLLQAQINPENPTIESTKDSLTTLDKNISELEKKTQPTSLKISKIERKAKNAAKLIVQTEQLFAEAILEAKKYEEKINQLNNEKCWKEFEDLSERKPLYIIRNINQHIKDLTLQIESWKVEIEKIKEYSNKLSQNNSEDIQSKQDEAKEIISASETLKMDKTLLDATKRAEKIIVIARESKKTLDNIVSTMHTCKRKVKSNFNAEMKALKNLEIQLKKYSSMTTATQTIFRKAKNYQKAIEKIEKSINAYHGTIHEARLNFSECYKKCHNYETEQLSNLINETKTRLTRSLKLSDEAVRMVGATKTLADDVVADLNDLIFEVTYCDIIRRSIERDAARTKLAEQKIILRAESIYEDLTPLMTLTQKRKINPDQIEEADEKSSDVVETIAVTLPVTISRIKEVELEIKQIHARVKKFNSHFDNPPKIPEYELPKLKSTIAFLEQQASVADIVSTNISDQAQKTSRGMQFLDNIKNQIQIMDNIYYDSKTILSKMSKACEAYFHPDKIDYLSLNDMQRQMKDNILTIEAELKLILLIRKNWSADISLKTIELIKEQETKAKSILCKAFNLVVLADKCIQWAEELRLCHSRKEKGYPFVENRTQFRLRENDKAELTFCSSSNLLRQNLRHSHENKYVKKVLSPAERIQQCEKIYCSLVSQFAERKIISPTDQQVLIFILRAILIELAFTAKFNQKFRNNVVYNMVGYFNDKYSINELFAAIKEYISYINQEEKLNKDAACMLKDPLLTSLLCTQINQYISSFFENDHYGKLVELVTFESEGLIEKSSLKPEDKDFAHQSLLCRMIDHAIKSRVIALKELSNDDIQQYIYEHHPKLSH